MTQTQLGYSVSGTATEVSCTSGAATQLQSFSLPSKGVWLMISNVSSRTTGGAGTVENKELVMSLTTANMTQIGTAKYYEESDDGVGSNSVRFVETITTVVAVTAATNIFVNAKFNVSGLSVFATSTISATRIG